MADKVIMHAHNARNGREYNGILKQALKDKYMILPTASEENMIRAIFSGNIDGVFLSSLNLESEIQSPGDCQTGLTLAELALRAGLPVVVLTGTQNDVVKYKLKELGVTEILEKGEANIGSYKAAFHHAFR